MRKIIHHHHIIPSSWGKGKGFEIEERQEYTSKVITPYAWAKQTPGSLRWELSYNEEKKTMDAKEKANSRQKLIRETEKMLAELAKLRE